MFCHPFGVCMGVVAVIRGYIAFHPCLYSCQAFGLKGRSYTSPERALRPQAGVKPLLKGRSYTNPERVTEHLLHLCCPSSAEEICLGRSGVLTSSQTALPSLPFGVCMGVVVVIRGFISFHPCLYSCQAFGLKGGKRIKNIIWPFLKCQASQAPSAWSITWPLHVNK